jgi:parallel beta-helix repeat protein
VEEEGIMRKDIRKKVFVVGMLVVLLCAGGASGLNVDKKNTIAACSFDGNTYTVDDEGDGDFTTIIDAIMYASDGDIIEVYSGTYYDYNITVDKTLTILGIDQELGSGDDTGNPILDLSARKIGFVLLADGILISNFNITNVSKTRAPRNPRDVEGAIVIQSNGNHITDNHFPTGPSEELQGNGIYLLGSNDNVISNNYFYNSFCGIGIIVSENNTISHNHFLEGNGITLAGAHHNTLYGNEFSSGCTFGIYFLIDCKNNIVSYNTFNFSALILQWSRSTTIEHNNFHNRGKSILVIFLNSYQTNWQGNYWETLPQGRPKIILGKAFFLPWINIDWHPAPEPNEIPPVIP